jgi:hypothetical protein
VDERKWSQESTKVDVDSRHAFDFGDEVQVMFSPKCYLFLSLWFQDEDEAEHSRKNPRRGGKSVSYTEDNNEGEDPMDVDSGAEEDNPASDDEMEDAEGSERKRRSKGRGTTKTDSAKENMGDVAERRTSSRATKFKNSMKEPSDKSIRDLLKDTTKSNEKSSGKARRKSSEASANDSDDEDSDAAPTTPKKPQRQNKRGGQKPKAKVESSPHKSPARRQKHPHRLSISHATQSDESDESSVESDGDDDDEEEEPFKIQRILASRTEPKSKWLEICKNMNTSEIDHGSRWVQSADDNNDEYEERFLVKWADASYLHVSWETEKDLLEQVEGAKTYLATFFRKSSQGLLFDADERCDGDYFDPAWTQVDRILEVQFPDTCPIKSVKDESTVTNEELGIVLDVKSPDYENGLGREFLVKWGNTAYSESTYEYERDLILNEVEYKEHLESFNRRRKRVSIGIFSLNPASSRIACSTNGRLPT